MAGATEEWIAQREADWCALEDGQTVTVTAGELKALLRQARDRMMLMDRDTPQMWFSDGCEHCRRNAALVRVA